MEEIITPSQVAAILLVSALAGYSQTPLTKLLIEKGLITEAEFMTKLSAERETYQAMLQKMKVSMLAD